MYKVLIGKVTLKWNKFIVISLNLYSIFSVTGEGRYLAPHSGAYQHFILSNQNLISRLDCMLKSNLKSISDAWMTMVSMMTGAICYAIFIGHSAALIQSFDASGRLYREKVAIPEKFISCNFGEIFNASRFFISNCLPVLNELMTFF